MERIKSNKKISKILEDSSEILEGLQGIIFWKLWEHLPNRKWISKIYNGYFSDLFTSKEEFLSRACVIEQTTSNGIEIKVVTDKICESHPAKVFSGVHYILFDLSDFYSFVNKVQMRFEKEQDLAVWDVGFDFRTSGVLCGEVKQETIDKYTFYKISDEAFTLIMEVEGPINWCTQNIKSKMIEKYKPYLISIDIVEEKSFLHTFFFRFNIPLLHLELPEGCILNEVIFYNLIEMLV